MSKILIAEDAPDSLQIFVVILTAAGHIVTACTDGQYAVEAFTPGYDLVILDLAMPRKNGFDAAKEIHAIQPDAKIVFLTAYDEPLSISRAQLGGVEMMWGKPITAKELLAKVEEVLA